MTQDELWTTKWQEVMHFMETHKRNPSKHRLEEHKMLNFVKHSRKLMNAGKLNPARQERFQTLLERWEQYKHINQYS